MISLKPFTYEDAEELCSLFKRDHILRNELNLSDQSKFSADDEFKFVTNWCAKTNSVQYAIMYGNEFAGMISLSHIDKETGTARTGYWVGSEFRNRGTGKKAFELILSIAKSKGIEVLESDIDKSNLFSLKLWEKYNPVITEKNETQYTLRLLLFKIL